MHLNGGGEERKKGRRTKPNEENVESKIEADVTVFASSVNAMHYVCEPICKRLTSLHINDTNTMCA